MEKHEKVRPNYVREWFALRREKFKAYVEEQFKKMGNEPQVLRQFASLEEEMKQKP